MSSTLAENPQQNNLFVTSGPHVLDDLNSSEWRAAYHLAQAESHLIAAETHLQKYRSCRARIRRLTDQLTAAQEERR